MVIGCPSHAAPWLSLFPSLYTAVFHTPALMLLSLMQKQLNLEIIPALVRLCQLLITPGTPEKSPHIGSLSKRSEGKGLIVNI